MTKEFLIIILKYSQQFIFLLIIIFKFLHSTTCHAKKNFHSIKQLIKKTVPIPSKFKTLPFSQLIVFFILQNRSQINLFFFFVSFRVIHKYAQSTIICL